MFGFWRSLNDYENMKIRFPVMQVNHHPVNPSQFTKLLKKVKGKSYWRRGFKPPIFPIILLTSTGTATLLDPTTEALPRSSTRVTKRGFLRWRSIGKATRKISSRLSIAMMKKMIMNGLRWLFLRACFPPSINFHESLSHGEQNG
jgi:hypothetical protein